jgi:AI-2 transport protein TqsA
VVVIVAGLKLAEAVIVPLIFATFLAVLSAPAVLRLRARGVPDTVAVPIVVTAVLGGLFGIAVIIGRSLNDFVLALPRYEATLLGSLSGVFAWLEKRGFDSSDLQRFINPGALLQLAGSTMSGIASSLSDAVLITLTVAFMLFEAAGLPQKIREAIGNPTAQLAQLERVVLEVQRYVILKTYVSTATGAVVGCFTAIIGLDFPLLWGLLGFVLNYVPNVGSVLAAIPPVLLAVVQLGWTPAFVTLIGFVVIGLVIGNVIEPRLMGRRLGLSTLVVWLSLLFWGWLWGPIGMLLSVPLTVVMKIALEHTPEFRAFAILMDVRRVP